VKTALKIALLLQIVTGLHWTLSIAMLEGQGGLEVLYRFVLVFSVQAGGFLFGVFAAWKYPQERGLARWLLGLPFVFFLLPGLLKTALGGRVTGGMLTLVILALVATIMVASLVVPRRIAKRLPAGLFRSRLLNGLILVGPLLGWLIFAGVLLWVFGVEDTSLRQARSSGTGYGVGVAFLMAATWLTGIGAASLGAACWGLLGLRSGVDGACRKLNIGQMLLALPGLLAGAFALYFLASQN
jgi:hypothetical protein